MRRPFGIRVGNMFRYVVLYEVKLLTILNYLSVIFVPRLWKILLITLRLV